MTAAKATYARFHARVVRCNEYLDGLRQRNPFFALAMMFGELVVHVLAVWKMLELWSVL